jgi:hypothetical protein
VADSNRRPTDDALDDIDATFKLLLAAACRATLRSG